MFQKLRPLGTKVWVERIEEEKKTTGGLFIPDSAKQDAQTGKVLNIGDEIKYVKTGDTIFFGKYSY
jgi:chaperonin GroES